MVKAFRVCESRSLVNDCISTEVKPEMDNSDVMMVQLLHKCYQKTHKWMFVIKKQTNMETLPLRIPVKSLLSISDFLV